MDGKSPLISMVLRWFLDSKTIGSNGFPMDFGPETIASNGFQWFLVTKTIVTMVFQWFLGPKTIGSNGFPMVFGHQNHGSDGFPMVGMVTIHRSGLFVFVGVIVQASFSFCVFVFVSILLGLEPTRLLFPARSSHMSLLPAFHSTCSDAVWHLLGISPQIQNTKRITNTNWHLTTNTQENQTHY